MIIFARKDNLIYLCIVIIKKYEMDVKSRIKEKGWTIDRVASAMGVTRVTLSQNLSRNPTVKTLKRVADIIGCSVGDFFLDEIETSKTKSPTIICPHCGKEITIKAE